MTKNEQLIQKIYDDFQEDDESAEKKGARLRRTYKNASKSQRQMIDDIFITLTGWSLKTQIETVDDPNGCPECGGELAGMGDNTLECMDCDYKINEADYL